jgi:hypothetical protein
MVSQSPDKILTQIGLRSSNGCLCDSDVACQVINELIWSGKLTVEDASNAVKAVKAAASSQNTEGPTMSQAQTNIYKTKSVIKPNGNNIPKSATEKYRTRHIALHFSYDGTNYSGFAQNIGKECDNSVEKALFAALEKTRLLVSPDQMEVIPGRDCGNGDGAAGDISARTASKYSRCGRTDKGKNDSVVKCC